jgi:aldehyde:ferredoxin oxidoreductase
MLLLGGPDLKWNPAVHDDNPPRFYEPLPTGPYKGKATQRMEVEEAKRKYYAEAGWDEKGIPKSDALRKLGLRDVDKALKNLHVSDSREEPRER